MSIQLQHSILMSRGGWGRAMLVAVFGLLASTGQAQTQATGALKQVTITAQASPDPVEKSYVKMIRGMDFFESHRAMAPEAQLRYKLLPRKPDSRMDGIQLNVVGSRVEIPVPVAADNTFTLERNAQAINEDALVMLERRALTMTWRADIRSPGVPDGSRRLGDLRLECEVGLEADLVSNVRSIVQRIANALTRSGFCQRNPARYYFFADRPLFAVTLISGERRQMLPIGELYAGLVDDASIANALPYCDCEVLLDRTYFLPLGDASWPDDTRVEFEYMDEPADITTDAVPAPIVPGRSTRADVAALFGAAAVVRFDSGYEVWTYRIAREADARAAKTEFALLIAPSGVVQKTRTTLAPAGRTDAR